MKSDLTSCHTRKNYSLRSQFSSEQNVITTSGSNMVYERQECPLCKSDAEFCYVDAGNRKYFNCSKCRYFQISRRAEELLIEKPDTYKEALASKSTQAPEGHLLTILMAGDLSPELVPLAR